MLIMQTDFTMAVNILGGNHFIKNVFSYDVLNSALFYYSNMRRLPPSIFTAIVKSVCN